MGKGKLSMKKEKPQIGIRVAKPKEKVGGLGTIKFGKSWPDKTKYVVWEFECDDKAKKNLFDIGMELLAKDKQTVINYVIVEAIKNTAKLKKNKCKK